MGFRGALRGVIESLNWQRLLLLGILFAVLSLIPQIPLGISVVVTIGQYGEINTILRLLW